MSTIPRRTCSNLSGIASIDESVLIHPEAEESNKKPKVTKLSHPTAVKAILPFEDQDNDTIHLITACGDTLRVYDASASLDTPELLNEIDAHAHDVTGLRVWLKVTPDGPEIWIVSASLDGTIRRWQLQGLSSLFSGGLIYSGDDYELIPDLVTPAPSGNEIKAVQEEKRLDADEVYQRGPKMTMDKVERVMTEEEERELEELLNED